MRVLVTGGTGYVGSHTVAALVAGGHQVRLLVRDPRRGHCCICKGAGLGAVRL
jgi:uncharacterized protein YbjT (DUF2867 family)